MGPSVLVSKSVRREEIGVVRDGRNEVVAPALAMRVLMWVTE